MLLKNKETRRGEVEMIPTKLLLVEDEEAFVKPDRVDSQTLTGTRGRVSTVIA
jgi:hypothetical protein